MPSFITISPLTGSGEVELSISGSTYTGRESRSTSFTLSGSVGGTPVTPANALVVTQTGKGAPNGFISLSTTSSTSGFSALGGPITFSGKSNLEKIKLTFGNDASSTDFTTATIGTGTTPITTVSSFTSGDGYTTNLGASEEYDVSFTFTIPENQTTSGKTYKYSFKVGNSTYDVTVSQSARSAYNLAFSASSASVNADGTLTSPSSVSVNADSGLTWTITGQ